MKEGSKLDPHRYTRNTDTDAQTHTTHNLKEETDSHMERHPHARAAGDVCDVEAANGVLDIRCGDVDAGFSGVGVVSRTIVQDPAGRLGWA